MVYFCLHVVVFFSLSGFFSRISSSFFSSFCFTASPFSINCFLFARDVQQLFTILSSIYLFICCHRSTLSIWWGQFFWRHLCLVYVKFIVKTTASLLCLRTVSIWLIDGTLGTMYPREREKVFRVLVQPPKRTFVHRRSYPFPVLQTPSESVEQRKRRWPLHFCKFYNGRGTYDLMANIFRDLEDRRWPWWGICSRELNWQNWLCKSWNM